MSTFRPRLYTGHTALLLELRHNPFGYLARQLFILLTHSAVSLPFLYDTPVQGS